MPGLVDIATLRPGDLIGVNKDSYLILDALPPEYDARFVVVVFIIVIVIIIITLLLLLVYYWY